MTKPQGDPILEAQDLLGKGLNHALIAMAIFAPAALMLKLDLPRMVTLTAGIPTWAAASGFWLLALIGAWEAVKRKPTPGPVAGLILVIGLPPAVPALIALL